MSFRPYHVQQGDNLKKILFKNGRAPDEDTINTVLNHDNNKLLFTTRRHDILFPGDTVWIPPPRPKEVSLKTDTHHEIRITTPESPIQLFLRNPDQSPISGRNYELEVSSNDIRTGTTSSEGKIEEMVPITTDRVLLRLANDEKPGWTRRTLYIGHLDPVHTRTGLQARLSNLGYSVGRTDGDIGTRTTEGARRFQQQEGLHTDGSIGVETRDRILKMYGF